MVSCPYCGSRIESKTSGGYYCPNCQRDFDFKGGGGMIYGASNLSTPAIKNNIGIYFTDAANAARDFYHTSDNVSLWQSEDNKLTINAEDIIINDDKISITINKDNIDKFNVIEINGVRFVKENN